MVLQHLKYQNKLSFTMLLVCISLLTACGSTKVNSNNTSEAHSGVDTENNVYSTKETEVATENEQDNTELGETFYTLGIMEKPKILFAYYYSVNWKYIDIGEGTEYRQEKIEDRKGAEIIFWHYAEQFSQYYGGGYDLQTASVDKVADCDFRMETEGNEDDLGKFCVAKIKVIAIEDGLSDEGEQEFDGPTYYAVVPESYLGETTFKGGGGVYEECSWNYYGGTYAVVAEAEDGKFTESEENDIIKFLSTFRQEYE